MIEAHYKCMTCGHGWVGAPGPQSFMRCDICPETHPECKHSECPACPACPDYRVRYIEWENYEELAAKHGWSA